MITDTNKRVLFLSETREGKIHDYKQLKDWKIVEEIPEEICLWVDLGFQGIKKDYPTKKISIAIKRKRGKNLTEEEKELNRLTASLRVLIENAIAGVKRMRILTDKYRNHRKGMEDQVLLISCALWNLHLKYSSSCTFPFL